MSTGLIVVTALCFVVGIGLSMWQMRRRVRNEVAERMTREAEKRIAQETLRRIEERLRAEKMQMAAGHTKAQP